MIAALLYLSLFSGDDVGESKTMNGGDPVHFIVLSIFIVATEESGMKQEQLTGPPTPHL